MKTQIRLCAYVLPALLAPTLWTLMMDSASCKFNGKNVSTSIHSSLCDFFASKPIYSPADTVLPKSFDSEQRSTSSSSSSSSSSSQLQPPQPHTYKDAIVYLTGANHIYRPERPQCPSLYDSIRSLDRHFPRDNSSNITLIIMSDAPLDNQTQTKLGNVSPFPIEFQPIIQLAHPELEPNATTIRDLLYKRMCAFWFYYFFELEFLPDYVMRMDTDSCLTSDMPSNPFRAMRDHHLQYMWYSTFIEPGFVIVELRDFVKKTITENPKESSSNYYEGLDHNHNVDLLWDDPNADEKDQTIMRVFSTNIEWFYMPAFRRADILQWKQLVLQDGGVYDHRWGDAPLRTIVATRFFNKSAVGRFCNFSYVHSIWQPFLPCDPDLDIHRPPARKVPKALENGKTIFTTFGWKQVG
jgi:hypothetical protein